MFDSNLTNELKTFIGETNIFQKSLAELETNLFFNSFPLIKDSFPSTNIF